MIFALTTRYKDSWSTLPMDKKLEIGSELYAFHDKYAKANKFKESYTFADGRLMTVWDVDSFEEMVAILYKHPYLVKNIADYELVPVIDHKGMKKVTEIYSAS